METLEKHPWLMVVAIGVVALLAYMSSGSGGPSVATSTVGGVIAPPQDPNAAAIQEAKIQAGQSNIGTFAALALGIQNASASLAASLAGTTAAQEVTDRQTNAAQDVTNRQTAAAQDVTNKQTAASVDVASVAASTQIQAANITAGTQVALAGLAAQAETQRAQDAYALQEATLANQKAIARAADNTSVVNGLVNGLVGAGELLLAFL